MCRVHTTEELANILETMADLFAWKHRKSLADAAAAARYPSRPRPHPAPEESTGGDIAPAPYPPRLRRPRPA